MITAAVILAGGASRRMGTPKALLPFQGETFLDRLIGLFEPVCSQIVVVLGHGSERVRQGITRNALSVVNPDPERGQLTSLQCGFAALNADAGLVFFTPVDYPGIRPQTVTMLHGAAADSAKVVVPEYRGKHGHPVLVQRQIADEILALPEEATARDVIHGYVPETLYIDVDDPGILLDVDDPEAYEALTQVVL